MPVDFETEIADLLNDISTVQDELFEVLANKRRNMERRDIVGLNALQPREESLCSRLLECQSRRAELLRLAAESGTPSQNLADLAKATQRRNEGDLSKRVKDASARMSLLQNETLSNWVLAQRSLLHVSQLLEIIATGGRLQPTYQKGDSVLARGALVDQDA